MAVPFCGTHPPVFPAALKGERPCSQNMNPPPPPPPKTRLPPAPRVFAARSVKRIIRSMKRCGLTLTAFPPSCASRMRFTVSGWRHAHPAKILSTACAAYAAALSRPGRPKPAAAVQQPRRVGNTSYPAARPRISPTVSSSWERLYFCLTGLIKTSLLFMFLTNIIISCRQYIF